MSDICAWCKEPVPPIERQMTTRLQDWVVRNGVLSSRETRYLPDSEIRTLVEDLTDLVLSLEVKQA